MQDWATSLGMPSEFYDVRRNIRSDAKGAELVCSGYDWYKSHFDTSAPKQRGKNGQVFEGLVLEALFRATIYPAYYQATVAFVPNVVYDILLFHPKHPVVLSCKTSLRERWKQADLEGFALKQVYRGAHSVLLTLNRREGDGVQNQIAASEVLGLDECIVIQSKDDRFDQLIGKLMRTTYRVAGTVVPVEGRILKAHT